MDKQAELNTSADSLTTARLAHSKDSSEFASPDSTSDHSQPLTAADSFCPTQEAVGVLSSRTSTYYLVRGRGSWIPIRFLDLYNADGEKVPKSTPFAQLKNSLVRVKYVAGAAIGHILPKGSGETQALFSEEVRRPVSTSPTAIRTLLSLTKALSEDVTALALAKTSNPSSIAHLIDSSRQHMMRKLPAVLEELEVSDTRKAQTTLKSLKLCFENASISQTMVVCDTCKREKSAYVISCGHRICGKCLGQRVRCDICGTRFTKVDMRLASGLRR